MYSSSLYFKIMSNNGTLNAPHNCYWSTTFILQNKPMFIINWVSRSDLGIIWKSGKYSQISKYFRVPCIKTWGQGWRSVCEKIFVVIIFCCICLEHPCRVNVPVLGHKSEIILSILGYCINLIFSMANQWTTSGNTIW